MDGVTGIYVSELVSDAWSTPEYINLQDHGKLALNGCAFIQDDMMWFCSARQGYTGLHWFKAEYTGGEWANWQIADFSVEYEVGELHISKDGSELYFHSDRPGGMGERDIWVSKMVGGEWQNPVNVTAVNTVGSEVWPALSPDGNQLWFSRNYGIWRSLLANEEWQAPEQMVSPLSGEPTIDSDGKLYFVHHFFMDDVMIEADIYIAYGK